MNGMKNIAEYRKRPLKRQTEAVFFLMWGNLPTFSLKKNEILYSAGVKSRGFYLNLH